MQRRPTIGEVVNISILDRVIVEGMLDVRRTRRSLGSATWKIAALTMYSLCSGSEPVVTGARPHYN
jgi:hypothetical protein